MSKRMTMEQGVPPQTGLALITVMLIVAMVASISAFLSLGQQIWLRQSGNIYDRSQAEAVRQGDRLCDYRAGARCRQ